MYTNITMKSLLGIIEAMCKNHNLEHALTQETLKITKLIKAQNYFKFLNKTYLQKMISNGAPTTSILSEVYLKYLENT
jgi:uncharacterized protein YaaQ